MDLLGPIFYSNHFDQSIEFYKVLGLELKDLQVNQFATFVFSSGKQLGIKLSASDREKPGSQTAMFKVSNVESLNKMAKKKDLNIVYPLKHESYGKTFIVADPDGNWIEFIE